MLTSMPTLEIDMIDFSRSFLTWTHHPHEPDPVYKYTGGLLADPGDVICVRLKADARLTISPDAGESFTCYVIAPCRAEYTIVEENLFQIPSGEYRAVFSETLGIPIGRRPSTDSESAGRHSLAEHYADFDVDIRRFAHAEPLDSVPAVIQATRDGALLNAACSYRDEARQLTVTIEFPVELINFDERNAKFQVCTEPVIVPDLATWDGHGLDRVFLAGVAFSSFDRVEFILQRAIEPATSELSWYH
ncbi:MAG: hypothetical protein F4Y02_12890, partial [Chloroflexi bacterium]|nr:hypothetical protein [Chloroflexota bacterium]